MAAVVETKELESINVFGHSKQLATRLTARGGIHSKVVNP